MGRNFLKGPHGVAANAVLAAAGYNFRRLLAWLAALWRALIAAIPADDPPLPARLTPVPSKRNRQRTFFTDDLFAFVKLFDREKPNSGSHAQSCGL
jgi:hypothetical protein